MTEKVAKKARKCVGSSCDSPVAHGAVANASKYAEASFLALSIVKKKRPTEVAKRKQLALFMQPPLFMLRGGVARLFFGTKPSVHDLLVQ